MTMTKSEIESELLKLLADDQRHWVRIADLMMMVDSNKLYKPQYTSFTAWVNSMSEKSGTHVSLFWKRLKAGRSYKRFSELVAKKGENVPTLEESNLSAEVLELIEKIAGKDDKILCDLTSKAISGDLQKKDLQQAWKDKKDGKHNPVLAKYNNNENIDTPVTSITAKYIIDALRTKNESCNYKTFFDTEFAINTGTTRHKRRLDAITISNELNYDHRTIITGYEIKVSKNDLSSDHKMAEYVPFVDLFYIVIPDFLLEDAKSILPPDSTWGIITIDENKNLSIAVTAKHSKGAFRADTLETAVYKHMLK